MTTSPMPTQMTADQWRRNTEALLAMAKKGVLVPRVPFAAIDLLKAALELVPVDREGAAQAQERARIELGKVGLQ